MRDITVDLVWTKIQMAFTMLGGWLGWYLGGADGLLITLVIFTIMDYVTGVMCAIIDKALSSEIGFKGLFRKVLIFALVGIGHVIDAQVIGEGGTLRSAIICFYLSNEGLSMLENAAHLGLPVPDKLKDILAQLHQRDSKVNNKEGDE